MSKAGEYVVVRALMVRSAGVVYCIAFLSMWSQVDGLIGSDGILPAADYLRHLEKLGISWERAPTLLWLDTADVTLHLLCGSGVVLSGVLIAGFIPVLSLVVLWVSYLSLTIGGSLFFSYQWDALLLEFGFLAIWWAPLYRNSIGGWGGRPSMLVLWLHRLLLFRLMLSSGLVKLLSGDRVWRDLSALEYHYETQPLPTWTSWMAHQLPDVVHLSSTALMFTVEIVVPFAIFGSRRIRVVACMAMAALQVAIAATGNYGFFNLLTLILCLSLIDDELLRKIRIVGRLAVVRPVREWPGSIIAPVAGLLLLLGGHNFGVAMGVALGDTLTGVARHLGPFRVSNSYGLFAVMTTTRPELVIEGSMDGTKWQAYELPWKAGATDRRPAFASPHMPRLDWQLWFAALRSYDDAPWISNLLIRVLQASGSVTDLLEHDPFAEKPPRFVRVQAYEYSFSSVSHLWCTGEWWHRRLKGPYSPVFSLEK